MNKSFISSQKLNLNPNPINNHDRSQEGFFTGLLIAIAIFYGLGILSFGIDSISAKLKINNAYKSLSEEEKQKLKDTMQKIYQEMKDVYDKESTSQFKAFKSAISKYKNVIDINSANLASNFENSLNKTLKKIEDGKISEVSNIKYKSFSIDFTCTVSMKTYDDETYDAEKEIDSIDSLMNATNVDDEEEKIKINIGESLIFKNVCEKYTCYDHYTNKLVYYTFINFAIDNAKFKKELGFFFDKLNKRK